jgi:hypothetical protein
MPSSPASAVTEPEEVFRAYTPYSAPYIHFAMVLKYGIAEVMLRVISRVSNINLVITQDIHPTLALFTTVIGVLTEATGRVAENSADCLAHGAHRRGSG